MPNLLRGQAEALAIPWVALEGLRRCATHPTPDPFFEPLGNRLGLHNLSERTAELLRDAWPDPAEPLLAGLRRHAERRLQLDDRCCLLRIDERDPGREVLAWRFVSLRLPPAMFCAAATPVGCRPPVEVRLVREGLLFGHLPLAHLHLHVKAAGHFELLWSHLAARRQALGKKMEAPTGLKPAEWEALLVRARLARLVLAGCRCEPEGLVSAVDRLFGRGAPMVQRAIDQLVAGRVDAPDRLQETYLRHLSVPQRPTRNRLRRVEDLWTGDPLADGEAWPEGRLLALMVQRLGRSGASGRGYLERLAIQYLRVRALLHAHLVQDAGRAGLACFGDTFDRLKPYREGMDDLLAAAALDEPPRPQAVEPRMSPKRARPLREAARGLAGRAAERGVEAGWVIHFGRAPEQNGRRVGTFRKHFLGFLREARSLKAAFLAEPGLLRTIRGLDLAGNERRGPLWLAARVLRDLRDHSRRWAARSGLPPLRLTLHAGEDFAHLASGLRFIDEPFRCGLIERGDRLGHALALGLDPKAWCGRFPRVLVPRGERLLDLVWMIGCVEQEGCSQEGERPADSPRLRAALERLLAELAEARPALARCSVADAFELYRRLFSETPARILLGTQPRTERDGGGGWEALLQRYLLVEAPELSQPVEVVTAEEAPLLQWLQQSLGRRIARWQVTIEVNPSSNLLIAGLTHPLDQPMFHLRPIRPDDERVQSVCIAADDPLTFATCLADEYAYAWAGMVVCGKIGPAYAQAWLDEATRAGWRARFTLGGEDQGPLRRQ